MTATSALPKVAGSCPACGHEDTLFLAHGGYVHCSRSACPDRSAIADLLDRPRHHVLDVRDDGWSLQHAVTCFPDLLDCQVHQELNRAFMMIRPPAGRYRVTDDLRMVLLEGAS